MLGDRKCEVNDLCWQEGGPEGGGRSRMPEGSILVFLCLEGFLSCRKQDIGQKTSPIAPEKLKLSRARSEAEDERHRHCAQNTVRTLTFEWSDTKGKLACPDI